MLIMPPCQQASVGGVGVPLSDVPKGLCYTQCRPVKGSVIVIGRSLVYLSQRIY
jgi:hypothetical protein